MRTGKNILILSCFFPPCNKVGGRRWAKFGKCLTERGHRVFVIRVDVPFSGSCPWETDILSFKERIFELPYIEHQPYFIRNKAPKTFAGKINYRISFYIHQWRRNKRNPSDISVLYENPLIQMAKDVIQRHQIETVVVTGGPWHWCYAGMSLKDHVQGVKFILDMRDFWTHSSGFQSLPVEIRKEEERKESFCISRADQILTPAQKIIEYLTEKYPAFKQKMQLIPHAFDRDEVQPFKGTPNTGREMITMAYGGVMYSHMEYAIHKLIDFIHELNRSGIRVRVDIYTFDTQYRELFTQAGLLGQVTYHGSVSSKELFRIFAEKDILLQLRAGEAQEQHFKSTKFYELIAFGKPIIYFGPPGDVSQFLTDNRLGFDGNRNVAELAASVKENLTSRLIPDPAFQVNSFEFRSVTESLEKFL